MDDKMNPSTEYVLPGQTMRYYCHVVSKDAIILWAGGPCHCLVSFFDDDVVWYLPNIRAASKARARLLQRKDHRQYIKDLHRELSKCNKIEMLVFASNRISEKTIMAKLSRVPAFKKELMACKNLKHAESKRLQGTLFG